METNKNKENITVWSKPNCMPCKQVKRKFDKEGVDYEEKNLEDYPEKVEEFKAKGYMASPVVEAPGKTFAGYLPNDIAQVVSNHTTAQYQAQKGTDYSLNTLDGVSR